MPKWRGFAVANYWRCAISDTLVGYSWSIVVAALLLLVATKVWPDLEEIGSDIGINLQIVAERWRQGDSPIPSASSGRRANSYVFLDVDPEADDSDAKVEPSQLACDALVRQPPPYWRPPSTPLRCPAGTPINRLLLSSILRELRTRDARLIVLDVEVTHEPGAVPEAELKALDDVLSNPVPPSTAPIVFAAPMVRYGDDDSPVSQIERDADLAPPSGARALPAVAIAPAMPVRRYARCFAVEGKLKWQRRRWPTLPYLAQRIAQEPTLADASPSTLCEAEPEEDPPRIVYTVPSLGVHQDSKSTPHRDDWAFYRAVYNRCLASRFWDRHGSLCGYTAPGHDSLFKGKVVVVGASNPLRRDLQFTPVGTMSGAEVIVNAMRSFEQFPAAEESSYWPQLGKEALIALVCSVPWLLLHAFNEWLLERRARRQAHRLIGWSPLRLWLEYKLKYWPALTATLIAVVGVSAMLTLTDFFGRQQSFNVLLGVLAVCLEQYAEVARWFHGGGEGVFDKLCRANRAHESPTPGDEA